jgi:hypothetical protein
MYKTITTIDVYMIKSKMVASSPMTAWVLLPTAQRDLCQLFVMQFMHLCVSISPELPGEF